jgi:hypothetical protein
MTRPPPARRRCLQTLLAASLAGSIDTAWLIRTALAAGLTPVPAGLHRLRGTATVNGKAASEGMAIRPGDEVGTGPNSEAVYVIGQDAFLQRENTVVRLGTDAASGFLRLVTGKLLSVFGKGERRLLVPTATIGIRGTGCYLETDAAKTYFCLCYGEAEVVPAVAPAAREVIRTAHHDHPIHIHNDPAMPTGMVPATVVNHSDAELTLLENLVGRWPPFHGQSGFGY